MLYPLPLPLGADENSANTIHVNARVMVREEGDVRIVFVAGLPILRYDYTDNVARALAMVALVQDGHASVSEVAAGFECARLSIYRYLERYEGGGVQGLVRGRSGPKGASKLGGAAGRRMLALKRAGVPNMQIATRLGVTETAVRSALKRAGYAAVDPGMAQESLLDSAADLVGENRELQSAPASIAREPPADGDAVSMAPPDQEDQETGPIAVEVLPPTEQVALDGSAAVTTISHAIPAPVTELSEAVVPAEQADQMVAPGGAKVPDESAVVNEGVRESGVVSLVRPQVTSDTDPSNRTIDRFLARMGLLDDAAPLFGTQSRVPGVGVLLAIPALLQSGVFGAAQHVYGSLGPAFYGVRNVILTLLFMALLRVKRPEALRRASPVELGRLLGLDRAPEVKTLRRKLHLLAGRGKSEEFVRELARARVKSASEALGFLYVDGHVRVYNGKHPIPKAHVTQLRLAMPATVDHWVGDANGDPVFVVTATPSGALARELPAVLREVRTVIGDRRLTVVFDRGGWSPKLFKEMIETGFDVLTYRKGRIPKVRLKRFQEHAATIEGRDVKYQLAERSLLLLKGQLRLREVVRLSSNGKHQTSIVTSRTDLSAIEVAQRMFDRWRQENFFKYMDEEFALDALVMYGVEDADGDRLVPNPERKGLDKDVSKARAELRDLQRQYGEAAANNQEALRPTMRGFKIANGEIGQRLRQAREKIEEIVARRRGVPHHVPAKDAAQDGRVVRLRTDAKRLTDGLKMLAYQAETALYRMLEPHYPRNEDDGRKLILACFQSIGDITVTADELRVTLEPAASPNRTLAIARLCDELNATESRFPGSALRLHYSIKGVTEATD